MIAPTHYPPNILGFCVFISLIVLATLWALLLYHLFERQTDRIYTALSRFL